MINIKQIAALFENFKAELKEEFATKKDINKVRTDIRELKDDVAGIRKELDTEHEFRYKRIEKNSEDIEMIKQYLSIP